MTYSEFKQNLIEQCDDLLQDEDLSSEEKQKIAWLRSRIIIEM